MQNLTKVNEIARKIKDLERRKAQAIQSITNKVDTDIARLRAEQTKLLQETRTQ